MNEFWDVMVQGKASLVWVGFFISSSKWKDINHEFHCPPQLLPIQRGQWQFKQFVSWVLDFFII